MRLLFIILAMSVVYSFNRNMQPMRKKADCLITSGSCMTPTRLQVLWSAPGNGDNIAKKAIDDVQKELSKKVDDVEATIGKIKSAPRDLSTSIDKTLSDVKKNVETAKKIATDAYNAPGYYAKLAQEVAEKAKKRQVLMQEQGFNGVFAPLDGSSDTVSIDPEEMAKKDAEKLKNGVAAFFDVAEQVVVATPVVMEKTLKIARSLPEKTKQVKADIERLQNDVENLPKRLKDQKDEAKRQVEAKKAQVAAFSRSVISWLSLEEPTRITNEVLGKVKKTKDGVETLVSDVGDDLSLVKDVVMAIPDKLETTKGKVVAIPDKVVSAVEEIQADVQNTKKAIVAIPDRIEQKKASIISSVDQTKSKVEEAAQKINIVADKVGMSASSVASTLSQQEKQVATAKAKKTKEERENNQNPSFGGVGGVDATKKATRVVPGQADGFLDALKGGGSSSSSTAGKK